MSIRDTTMLLGVDTGGTFTDFVLCDGEGLRTHKVLSTPHAPEQAILQGMRDLGLDEGQLTITHGSTVATNAVLEGKGVRTVFITNHGLGDLLAIGRQARRELYELQPLPTPPPVEPALCLETGGRLGADGSVVETLEEAELDRLRGTLAALKPEAVAINLLFSFLDDRFERAVEAIVPEGVFVSRSSAILPEYKEYERGITTWLNAWIGPVVERYLLRLSRHLSRGRLVVMQSSGGVIDAPQAARQAVHMLLSGPAGGLQGARLAGAAAGRRRLMSFDMGGTSTDVALMDGELSLTTEGRLAGYPVAIPMVDMHTIGAGGGSIASIDSGGMLRVGPQSAGAAPGPACYGRGGTRPTVTDANLVLGRLRADHFLGGRMTLDETRARAALGGIARQLNLSIEETAAGIVRIANEHMAHALRVISVQRGHDPRDFTLVSFGGAGGLHVCALADALEMTRAMVPVQAGVLSALGMLAAPHGRQLSRTCNGLLEDMTESHIDAQFSDLVARGLEALAREGLARDAIRVERSADVRYLGQSHTLNIPWRGLESTRDAFHELHEQRYGHRLPGAVELVNIRAGLQGPPPAVALPPWKNRHEAAPEWVTLHGLKTRARLCERGRLAAHAVIEGPALITEEVATSYIAPGWRGRVDAVGNLLLEKTGA